MGDKTAARRAAVECGVSVVPGMNQPLSGPDQAKQVAAEFGYPVILKAAMGGGGRGMRVVRSGERGQGRGGERGASRACVDVCVGAGSSGGGGEVGRGVCWALC